MQKANKLIILLALLLAVFQIPAYSQFLSTCTDSDQGNNINQAGTLTLSSIFRTVTKRDFCSSGQLIEYFCRDNKIGFEIKTCPSQTNCYQGACVGASGQPTPSPPQNPPEVICPAVCTQMYLLEGNTCTFTNCGSGCGPNSINSFSSLEECQTRITNPPSQPPQQPRTNYPNPPSFSLIPPTNIKTININGETRKQESIDTIIGVNGKTITVSDMDDVALESWVFGTFMYSNYIFNLIDYNKDGLTDLSVNSGDKGIHSIYGGKFSLFKGVSKTKVVRQDLWRIGVTKGDRGSASHYWKDVDKDGYEDLIVLVYVDYYSGFSAELYWNNKDGTFTEYQPIDKYRGPFIDQKGQFEDINGDNLPDLINEVGKIYFNNGNRQFIKGQVTGLPSISSCFYYCYGLSSNNKLEWRNVGVVDIDNDQDNDLIIVSGGNGELLYIAQNDGKGNFQTYDINTITAGAPIKQGLGYQIKAIDFDGDGDLDINYRGRLLKNLLIP